MARALDEQLKWWLETLPPSLRFDPEFEILDFDVRNASPIAPQIDDHVAFLRTQYLGCKTSFYWPAMESAISAFKENMDPDPALVGPLRQLSDAALRYLASIFQLLNHRSPNLWTLSQWYCTEQSSDLVLMGWLFYWLC
jgi:hypothetical protein